MDEDEREEISRIVQHYEEKSLRSDMETLENNMAVLRLVCSVC